MTLISFSYQETLRAYGCARARGEIGYANKWYQGDMITGRLPLSEQRRHTKGGGENFSNQAKSLTRKATTSIEQSLAATTQRLAYFVVEQASDDDERKGCLWIALPSPRRILMDRCSCCAGNNPLICQSARSKFQTHMDTNTCHGRVRQRAKAVTKGSNLISHSQASGLGVKVCFARGQSTYVVSVCSPVSMRRPSHG